MKLLLPKSILDEQPPTKENLDMAIACAIDEIFGTDVDVTVEYFYDEPSVLCTYADGWNDLVRDELVAQCRAMLRMTLEQAPDDRSLSASLVHDLAVAARDADDDWHIESNYGVLFDNSTQNDDGSTKIKIAHARTRLDSKVYEALYEHPENYLLVVCTISAVAFGNFVLND